MDEKQRLAEAEKARYAEASSSNQPNPQGGAPPEYDNSRAGPVMTQQSSPYGPYNESGTGGAGGIVGNAPLPPLQPPQQGGSWEQTGTTTGQKVVVDGVQGTQLPQGAYVEVKGVPACIMCPNCHQPIVTQIETKTGTKTVVAAVAVALVFWPLAWLPFMFRRLKKKIHVCPYCKHELGKVLTVSMTTAQPYVQR
ncbi:hypothetical protein GGI21_005162 [Coemansia aciculifera]|nr:hypothetical protein GGI21_005162 [Coemansia aciculifera]